MDSKGGKSLLQIITNTDCDHCAIVKIISSYSVVNDLFLMMFLYKNFVKKKKVLCYILLILFKYALMFFEYFWFPKDVKKKFGQKKCP